MKSMKKCGGTLGQIRIKEKLDRGRNKRSSSAGMFYTSSAGAVTSLILMLLLGVMLVNTVFGASYSITYNDSVISDMPVDEAGTTSGSVPVSSNTPTSIERRFTGWCLGTSSSSNITTTDGVDSCSSTTYLPGASLPISQSSADNYLYAMWTNVVPVTFNLGTGVSSIVVDGTTILSSGTTLNLVANRGYGIAINYASGYMPADSSFIINSGDATTAEFSLFVGSIGSVATAISQTQKNVTVTFTLGSNTTNLTVNGKTVTSGGTVTLMGGNTYTVTTTHPQYYNLASATITSGKFYGISNVDTTNNKFDLTVGIDNGAVNVTSCITADTLVTLADGSKKRVADLTGDELLLVWDFDSASYKAAPITFIDSDPEKEYNIVHAYFSDEGGADVADVGIITEHGFYDLTMNKFVYIGDINPEQYIGHEFIMQDGKSYKKVRLTNIKHEKKVTTPYSPTTYKHFNYFTNDMLSMPGGIEGMFNYFEVDKDTMGYDKEKKQADIDKYGLLTLEDFNGLIDEIGFEAYQGKYLNISIGKGLITWEDIQKLAERYGHFTEERGEKGGENE